MRRTGLEKVCPRCARHGVVEIDTVHGRFWIKWAGPPRGPHGDDADRDGVNLETLLDPLMGCGYDHEEFVSAGVA